MIVYNNCIDHIIVLIIMIVLMIITAIILHNSIIILYHQCLMDWIFWCMIGL